MATGARLDPPAADWRSRVLDDLQDQIRRSGTLIEDERAADWQYLLPDLSGTDALVIGAGRGITAMSLARSCRSVVVVDGSAKVLALLSAAARAEGWPLDARHGPPAGTGELGDRRFGLVVQRLLDGRVRKGDAARRAAAVLREGGLAVFLTRSSGLAAPLWRMALRRAGLALTALYAPLPVPDRSPLALLPLRTDVSRYFLASALGLFEAASPEAKRSMAPAYRAAALAARLSRILPLHVVLPLAVRGSIVIARKAT